MNNVWILAQTAEQEGTSRVPGEQLTSAGKATTVVPDSNALPPVTSQRRGLDMQSLFFIGLMFVVMYFLLFRGPRKKQQQHKQMVQSLKKNDRVRTIGGILGTVVNIKDDEITLKIDESNNTKIKVASSAIGKILSKDEN